MSTPQVKTMIIALSSNKEKLHVTVQQDTGEWWHHDQFNGQLRCKLLNTRSETKFAECLPGSPRAIHYDQVVALTLHFPYNPEFKAFTHLLRSSNYSVITDWGWLKVKSGVP